MNSLIAFICPMPLLIVGISFQISIYSSTFTKAAIVAFFSNIGDVGLHTCLMVLSFMLFCYALLCLLNVKDEWEGCNSCHTPFLLPRAVLFKGTVSLRQKPVCRLDDDFRDRRHNITGIYTSFSYSVLVPFLFGGHLYLKMEAIL